MTALLTFCITVLALSTQILCLTSRPVKLSYGTYSGQALPNGVSQWLGMRYADPPLRFSAPKPPSSFAGTKSATKFGPGCQGGGAYNTANTEDCLFVDVFAPNNATSTSKLSVYVSIQGGGLLHATSHSNGSNLILGANMNLVTVTFTYRTGPFGFLASKEVQNNNASSLNNGYLDQRQLLQWVQKEIAQFGGDPGHVTLGGQSAGAGSVVNHLTAYGGRNDNLFQGAIMESQSFPPVRNVSQQQFQYDRLVSKTGCATTNDTLSCLRGLTYQKLLAGVDAPAYPEGAGGSPVYAWNPVLDGSFVRDLPLRMFANGQYVHVPIIFGDVTDEGTEFTPQTIATKTSSRNFLKNNFPALTSSQLDKYTALYGLDVTTTPSYWTKAAQAYGETRYTCPGIRMSNITSSLSDNNSSSNNNSSAQVWNWRYNILPSSSQYADDPNSTYSNSTTAAVKNLGVSHGSELGGVWSPTAPDPQFGRIMLQSTGRAVSASIQAYWTSFMRTFDPNALAAPGTPHWDAWTGNNRILFNANGTAMETVDGAQMARCAYWAGIGVGLQQ